MTQMQIVGPAYRAYESLTVSSTAVSFTAATIPQLADYALVTVESGAVRFRLDGTAPTATVGHELEDGDVLELNQRHELVNAKFIRRDGTDATLRCSFGV